MNKKSLLSFIVALSLIVFVPFPTMAQGADGENAMGSGPRKQLATIVFAGLAGAVLGLSTLSFYGRPQDKLSNIAVGFAIGIIAGTAYTTYKQATRPYGATEFERHMYFAELDKWESQDSSKKLILSNEWSF